MKIMPLIIIKIFAVMEIIFFFAMVMAEILFLVFGVILISAFYLIEKLIQKNFISEGEKTMKKIFLTNLKETIWEAVQVKAQSIYQIAYVYHRLYFINGKLSKIKLANKKHALAFISNKISYIFFSFLAKKVSFKSRRNIF